MSGGRLRNIEEIVSLAACGYRPQPFTGRVALFQATNRAPGRERDRQCWSNLATTLEVYELPGYSNWIVQFLMDPNVEILANKLSACLREIQDVQAGGRRYA